MGLDHQHHAGSLKQQNKKHKTGRHRSKGAVELANKGRVNILRLSHKRKIELSRDDRRNQANQIRKNKREAFLEKRRGICEVPFLVAIVPLSNSIDTASVLEKLKTADEEAVISETLENHIHINIPRWKQRFTFVTLNGDNMFDILDVLKAATTVMFLTPAEGFNEEGDIILSTCLAQGLPATVVVVPDLDTVPLKKRHDCKTSLQEKLSKWLPDEKVQGFEKDSDALTVLRRISSQKLKNIIHREIRPHLLAESVEFIETEVGRGRVSVGGFLRGQKLSANSVVHIPGWGDFQMSSIEVGPSPDELELWDTADPNLQESLESENPIDPMDAEQTWPTKEDLEDAKNERLKRVKKVPKGFSDYQAAWIPDNDAFDVEDSGEEDGSMNEDMMGEDDEDSSVYEDAESTIDYAESTTSELMTAERYDKNMDLEEEKDALEKIKKAKEDKEFPDEVDTPMDVPARVRFQKYRGLLSFRTTPWDVKENLPLDYARIFQFKNLLRTKKEVVKTLTDRFGADAGCYVRVHIEKVPTYLVSMREASQPLVVFGLLPHEQKMSLVNVVLKRPPSDQLPIKSKDTLYFQCGFRRFKAAPIFSHHTNGNKYKYARYFQPESRVVASFYAPIMYPPASVLAFKENNDASLTLVATGSLLSVDPDRLVIKRTILSGHLFKVNKKSAVVRFMFFNKEDIDWFKPVQLRTKYGRQGHIKESLGTHGHMKCVFNNQLKSQDTVLMHLYKRVFPKWTYNPNVNFMKLTEPQDDEMEQFK